MGKKGWEREVLELMTFNVEEAETSINGGDWGSYYKHFIDKIRTKYFPIDDENPEQQQLLLHLQYSSLSFSQILGGQYLDILLQTRSHSSKVRIYLFEFELVGYQMENNPYEWLEFGNHHTWRRCLPRRQIPGSSLLEFNGDYENLLRTLGEGQILHNFVLGQKQLVTAVNFLATSTSRQERAWSLIVVQLMICGAVISTAVSNHFVVTFPCDLPLPVNLVYILYRISGASAAGLGWSGFDPQRPFGDRSGFCLPPSLGRPVVEEFTQMRTKQPAKRQHLMEVSSVRINSINGGGKSSGIFYGTISITDQFYSDHIYNRGTEEENEFVYFGDNLLRLIY